ncbi:MAG: hypothetical protein CVT87_03855, partial [Alphaproteobacteria bacterium HGW-Alphaproteobacteria-9]
MLDHARNLNDPPEPEHGPEADLRAVSASAGPAPIDPETARELLPYFRNAKALAPPTAAQQAGRTVLARVNGVSERYDEWRLAASRWFDSLDLAPDLAENIGSRRWFRGLGTMVGLGVVALALWPDLTPLEARPAMPHGDAVTSELRSQMILPLALGADSGRRMGPTQAVIPLKSAPERPQIQMMVTLTPGDSFAAMLRRAGVAADDIDRAAALVDQALPLGEIASGTQMDVLLGRRPAPGQPRPLDSLAFRARFDL